METKTEGQSEVNNSKPPEASKNFFDGISVISRLKPVLTPISSAVTVLYETPKTIFNSLFTYSQQIANAETREHILLSRIPFFISHILNKEDVGEDVESKSHPAIAKVESVDIGDDRHINTFMMDNDGDFKANMNKKNLVICHGYGAGLGFYFKNYEELSKPSGWRVFSIDWLGMGRSSRLKKLPSKKCKNDVSVDVQAVEDYFVESLEDWRKKCGIEKMLLVGHSLGGYFCTRYSLKYPEHVQKLVLASPAGIPNENAEEKFNNWKDKVGYKGRNLWDWNVTPQMVVRNSGPVGLKIIENYVDKRFPSLDSDDKKDMAGYLHAICSLEGSGEYALSRLLAAGAIAKVPLEEKLTTLKVPVLFLYGEYDWMDALAKLQSGELPDGSDVVIVPNAGHQLFLDNSIFFNKCILKEMDDYRL
jgi:pimeloyl-ACP methyl ester carboxylesterase